MPLFTIITPVFNANTTIRRTIESVINQNNSDYEYIIIDACSNDGTSEIIRSYGDSIHMHVCEPDRGIYDAMNKGIELATGEIIGIINADDYYADDSLAIIRDFHLKNNADVYYGDIRVFSEKNNYQSKPYNYHLLYWGMCLRHPACFVKKSVYKEVGCFNISYKIAGDYDFLLRVFLADKKFQYVPRILANFSREGLSNIQKYKSSYEQYTVRKKYNCLLPRAIFFVQVIYSKYIKLFVEKIISFF